MATQYNQGQYSYRRRRRRGKPKRFSRKMCITVFLVFCVCLFTFGVLLFKIYRINSKDGDRYRKEALSQQSYTNTVLNYQRGDVKDRNNTTLAVSVRKYDLVLEPRTLGKDEKKKQATVDAIAKTFGVASSVVEEVIQKKPNSMYEHIDGLKELPAKKVDKFKKQIKKERLEGVWFEEVYKRNYPLKTVGASIIGFMNSNNQGTYGVEEQYNSVLNGTTGREYGYFDSNMNLQRTIKEAKDGNSVVLTIDANVQKIIEDEIADFQKNGTGAKTIAMMVMNPKNGEILAMASNSTFDLNDPQNLASMYSEQKIAAMTDKEKNENLLSMWSNFCVGSAYEPGSTFKPFTIAAALDENIISGKSTFQCNGVKKVADREIHCSNRSGHGMLDLRHALMESCNAALMDIGLGLGRNKFSKYNKLYGFGQRTGVDLPGETSGLIHTKEELNPVELATSSFGQTQTVTMVQMLSGFSSLINGGNYYQPHLVKEIQNSNGDVVKTIDPVVVKRTTSEDTSSKLRSYLKSTVEAGTAAPAQVKGYSIGGKTGTAEKRPVSAKKYLVSFIGCEPAEDPEVAYYVIIDEPHVKDQAHSTYATEFSSKVMKRVLPFLGQYASSSQTKQDAKQE
ncbi:penicillin-binding transpeptidase domain-containing protein [Clostridium sp. AF36-4]|uniref:peptidoglycan D,D-transpeptidase FtsI family protein n=1 Tax=Clostridium sp. AF36-4 TaxID=2293015 RepID=UPI000E3F4547|nr:penicillin-binding transpeptidase domain-containing protein [Clostridium sp. AF36-4]RGF57309.1 peptidoglycan glycosyltransferase [Clostridium sp. AF36-4]